MQLHRLEAVALVTGHGRVGAEGGLGVGDGIERIERIARLVRPESPQDAVARVPLHGHPPLGADGAAQGRGRLELAVAGAGGGGDALVHERAAEIVGAAREELARLGDAFLDPRRLQVLEGLAQHEAGDGEEAGHVVAGGAGRRRAGGP